MAALKPSSLFFNSLFISICVLTCLDKSFATIDHETKPNDHRYHLVEVASLIPSTTSCIRSPKVLKAKSSLELVNKHGPCYKYKGTKASILTPLEILEADRARIQAINSRVSNVESADSSEELLPVELGNANFVVTIGLGTPPMKVALEIDTGSSITWTQCQPCVQSCYRQDGPIFDPLKSTSYANITCSSSACYNIGDPHTCSASNCVYQVKYAGGSSSSGFFAKERLSLTPTEVLDNFYFGCGQDNKGNWGPKETGILGLGRDEFSIVSQTATKYNKIFSYCLPSDAYTGFLKFGGDQLSSTNYTSMTNSAGSSFYGVNLVGITIGRLQLQITERVLSQAKSILDSGTFITRLPPVAYIELDNAFRQEMKSYPRANPISILDTCYDFRDYGNVRVPNIRLTFGGGAVLNIDGSRSLYAVSDSQVCLAFAAYTGRNDTVVIGSTLQRQFEVIHDVEQGRIGFAPNGCF